MVKNQGVINIILVSLISFVGLFLIYYGYNSENFGFSKKTGNILIYIGVFVCFINAVFWVLKLLKK